MSWLMINEVLLICETCDWSLAVNLQARGAIQIGDNNVAYLYQIYCEQQNLTHNNSTIERFLNTSHTMPLMCTCQNCYKNMGNAAHHHKIDPIVQDLSDCLDEIGVIYRNYTERQNNLDKMILDAFLDKLDGKWPKQLMIKHIADHWDMTSLASQPIEPA